MFHCKKYVQEIGHGNHPIQHITPIPLCRHVSRSDVHEAQARPTGNVESAINFNNKNGGRAPEFECRSFAALARYDGILAPKIKVSLVCSCL